MNTQANKSRYLPMLIVGIAVILFSTAGVAHMMGWGPNLTDGSSAIDALDQTAPVTASEAGARPRCPECGMIVSVREIERHDQDSGSGAAGAVTAGNRDETPGKMTKNYEITVRMAGGSSRVFNLASPARWRTGERLIVIGGLDSSN